MREDYRWLILASCVALSACTGSSRLFRAAETYHALGHDPGWLLTLDDKKLKFVTSRPNTVYESTLPLVQTSAIGRRYSTDRVTLDITNQPCNDVRSGIGFSDTVVVSANGYRYQGCGGNRVPLLDRQGPLAPASR